MMRERCEEATLCTWDWIWTGFKNSFLLHDQSSLFGSNVWSSWLNSLWYIIAYDCFIDSCRPAILCKTIKQCFAPSVPCVVFSKPKIKKHTGEGWTTKRFGRSRAFFALAGSSQRWWVISLLCWHRFFACSNITEGVCCVLSCCFCRKWTNHVSPTLSKWRSMRNIKKWIEQRARRQEEVITAHCGSLFKHCTHWPLMKNIWKSF